MWHGDSEPVVTGDDDSCTALNSSDSYNEYEYKSMMMMMMMVSWVVTVSQNALSLRIKLKCSLQETGKMSHRRVRK